MRQSTAMAALLLMAASPALAHQGGHHKSVKGTVQSVDERQVVVRTIEGKDQTIVLDRDTQCTDRKSATRCADVKEGDRVVVVTRSGGEGQTIADKITFSHTEAKRTDAESANRDHSH